MKRCHRCGCQIPPGAEVHDIVTEQVGKARRAVERTFCPQCARRAGLAEFLFKVIGLLLVGMGVIGLLGWLAH
jgi:hypothetical protein